MPHTPSSTSAMASKNSSKSESVPDADPDPSPVAISSTSGGYKSNPSSSPATSPTERNERALTKLRIDRRVDATLPRCPVPSSDSSTRPGASPDNRPLGASADAATVPVPCSCGGSSREGSSDRDTRGMKMGGGGRTPSFPPPRAGGGGASPAAAEASPSPPLAPPPWGDDEAAAAGLGPGDRWPRRVSRSSRLDATLVVSTGSLHVPRFFRTWCDTGGGQDEIGVRRLTRGAIQ